jgi:DNA-binding beta-propeller fold protein YncE
MLDMKGTVLNTIGKYGSGNGEFNFPTDLFLDREGLSVVDAMNFRVQDFNGAGEFQFAVGSFGEEPGLLFRPKGIAKDSEDHLYVVDSTRSIVQVFDHEGQLLYSFGGIGRALGLFQLPTGLSIDHGDRIYVVDSYNRRVQVFHYTGVPRQAKEVTR